MLPLYVGWTLLVIAFCGALYAVVAALLAGRQFSVGAEHTHTPQPAVTILKPLRGAEWCLLEGLASALRQDYGGPLQLVCGIQDEGDPAKAVLARLQAEFSDQDIVAVIDPRRDGRNPKISNCMNMIAHARHDILVLADSDIAVPEVWLSWVVASLNGPNVGLVSCFYAGEGQTGWSRLAAMGITYQFLPNAVFGAATGLAHPSFGSTIALGRRTLEEIGGFRAFQDSLADDFDIGRAVRLRGYRLTYAPLLVLHRCTEASLRALWVHELRWARTIRTIDPLGHWGSILTHALPWGLLAAAFLAFSPASLTVLATVVAARLFLKARMDHIAGRETGPTWLLPLRDLLSFAVFVASLFGDAVEWKDQRLRIGKHGAISEG